MKINGIEICVSAKYQKTGEDEYSANGENQSESANVKAKGEEISHEESQRRKLKKKGGIMAKISMSKA
jgi:hypothetical protein